MTIAQVEIGKIIVKSYAKLLSSVTINRKQNPVVNAVFKYQGSNLQNAPSYFAELLMVMPQPSLMNMINTFSKKIGHYLNPVDKDLSEFVELSRFLKTDGMDRIACDWCSISNGMMEYILYAFRGNESQAILYTNNTWFEVVYLGAQFMALFNDSSFDNAKLKSSMVVQKYIEESGIIVRDQDRNELEHYLKKIFDLRSYIASVESRWCPFKYIREMAYSRTYWGSDLEPVLSSVRKRGRSVCNDCVRTINQDVQVESQKPSIFESYLEMLSKNISNKA